LVLQNIDVVTSLHFQSVDNDISCKVVSCKLFKSSFDRWRCWTCCAKYPKTRRTGQHTRKQKEHCWIVIFKISLGSSLDQL